MTRWIRARITATDDEGRQKIFCDVGIEELRKLKKKFKKIEVVSNNDWGRYLHPRNYEEEEERKEMIRIIKERKK
jgi:glycogen synthase